MTPQEQLNQKIRDSFMEESPRQMNIKVASPADYYQGDFVMQVIERYKLGFCLGNVIKYVLRADGKGQRKADLKKALWYLQREITNIEAWENTPIYNSNLGGPNDI